MAPRAGFAPRTPSESEGFEQATLRLTDAVPRTLVVHGRPSSARHEWPTQSDADSNAPIAAAATCSSCADVTPLTPTAPITLPSITTGNPP